MNRVTLEQVAALMAELEDAIADLGMATAEENERIDKWNDDKRKRGDEYEYPHLEVKPGKEAAAVKRKSMDLTRALADLRAGR